MPGQLKGIWLQSFPSQLWNQMDAPAHQTRQSFASCCLFVDFERTNSIFLKKKEALIGIPKYKASQKDEGDFTVKDMLFL